MYLYNSKSEVRGFYNAYHNALNLDMEMLSKVFFLHVYLAIGAMSTDRYRIKKTSISDFADKSSAEG